MAAHFLAILSRSTFALALFGAVAVPCAALAESVPPEAPPAAVDARAFVGIGSGLAVDAWLPGRSLRVDLNAETIEPSDFSWGGLAVIVPLARTTRSFLGLRAGDTLEYTATKDGWSSGSRLAHAPDVGVVGHLESTGGSTLEGQVGVEAVLREKEIICCDDAPLSTSSFGVRIALRGELAVSRAWALVAQTGLRTADHILDFKFLPTFAVGVRVRFF